MRLQELHRGVMGVYRGVGFRRVLSFWSFRLWAPGFVLWGSRFWT